MISQRFAKVMLGWSANVASEVALIVGSEGPNPQQPEESSLTWDVETVRLYAQDRYSMRQELLALKQDVSNIFGGKDGTPLDKVVELEKALKTAVKAGEGVEYANHKRAIQRLQAALEKDLMLVVAFEVSPSKAFPQWV